MTMCYFCNQEVELPYQCNYCNQIFCFQHRLPPNHDCSNIREWESRSGPSSGTGEKSRSWKAGGEPISPYPTPQSADSRRKIPRWRRRGREEKHPRRNYERHRYRLSRRIKKLFCIFGLILIVITFGLIYGPEIQENFDVLSPTDVAFNFNKYLGKEITVEGYYSKGFFGDERIYGGKSMLGINVQTDSSFELIEGDRYRFTGIYKRIDSKLCFIVHQVEPVGLIGFFTKSTIVGMGIISIAVLLYRKRYIVRITLIGFILLTVGFLIMEAKTYPLAEVGATSIGFFPISWFFLGIGVLILVFVLYRHSLRWLLK